MHPLAAVAPGSPRRRLFRFFWIGWLVAWLPGVAPVSAGPEPGSQPASISPAREIVLPIPSDDDERGGLIVHDLTNDGVRELIVTRPGFIVAATLEGKILWDREVDIQVTGQSEVNGLPGWHGPGIQAGDVDGDGRAEVIYLTSSGFLEILEGNTGRLIRRIEVKAPEGAERWEHAVLVNFRGLGDRDLLLQATNRDGYRMGRYLRAYSFDELLQAEAPEPLWQRDDFLAPAHSGARVADLDGDGRDEVIGAGIVQWNGAKLYELPVRGHIDAVSIADVRPDLPGLEVVALEEGGQLRPIHSNHEIALWVNEAIDAVWPWGGANRVFLFGTNGLIWQKDYQRREPQNVAVGDFLPRQTGLEIWCRSRYEWYQKPFVFDANGALVTSYELVQTAPGDWTPKGVEVIFPIHWTGGEQELLAAKARHESGDVAVFDAINGEFLLRIPERTDRLFVADLLGDWREEIVVLAGDHVRIYENPAPNLRPDHESLWSRPHYGRMKQTWNYYVP